uniref:SDE2-like domain-containing protein n=1 Tax=Tabanus bromius TaxID=304241 RepID=A0A0K8TRL9_TABBR
MGPKVYIHGQELLSLESHQSGIDIPELIYQKTGLLENEYYLLQNGKRLEDDVETGKIEVVLRLPGGKGGFGSMLRAIGAQIEKTTNREACRDLNGRRLRDINEEKRLKAWLEKQKDRENEAEEKKRRKLAKLLAVPKHEFNDAQYEAARASLTERVSSAVEEGFKKLKEKDPPGLKRKAPEPGPSKKKRPALWIDDDISSSSDTDDDSDIEVGESSKSITKEQQSVAIKAN